jgi:hypothetical protein
MACALLAVLAAFLEIGEFVLFHNHSFEWVDVRDDLAGIASAALLVFAAERIRQRLARGSETASPAASER